MSQQDRSKLDRRVEAAAEAALRAAKYVAPVDVLAGLGWLPPTLLDDWRKGRVGSLEDVLSVRPDKLVTALELLLSWARDKGLVPSEVAYLAATRDKRPLRFTEDGGESAERVFRTHWISPELSDAQPADRAAEPRARPGRHRAAQRVDLHKLPGHRSVPDHGGRRSAVPDLCRHGPPGFPAGR